VPPRGGRRSAPPTRPEAQTGTSQTVDIDFLGARGDGVARVGDVPWFIPFALPGERVLATPRGSRSNGVLGELTSIERVSHDRIAPICQHFGRCGGCDLQHLSAGAYSIFKRDRVVTALARRGFEAPDIAPPEPAGVGERRRLALAALRTADGVLVGLHQQGAHRIEVLAECPVTHPALVQMLKPMSVFLKSWLIRNGAKADVMATVTDTGLDLLVEGSPPPPVARVSAGDFMSEAGIARLSWRAGPGQASEVVLELASPTIRLGGRVMPLIAGGFLQATARGEAAIVAAVRAGLGEPPGRSARLLDLFSGCGAISLPLAQDGWRVTAVERDAAALAALLKVTRSGTLTLPMDTLVRDLEDRPLADEELTGVGAVVFDPPRAGARPQATALARSAVPLVIAVSCNPETFARDARILVDGGYRMDKITVIDQFLWSHHVELTAVFRR
jgi:23S rRNA (uracil1939-C5)-methyltransferase